MIFDKSMPKLSWKYTEKGGDVQLSLEANGTMKGQRAWTAEAETRDFRKAQWTSQTLSETTGNAAVIISGPVTVDTKFRRPEKDLKAVLVETEFEVDGLKFDLSSQLRILEPKK